MSTARRRLGRRGVGLSVIGLGEVCWAIGYIAAPTTDRDGMRGLLAIMPLPWWAVAWAACGVTALVSAWLPEGRDRWGWITAVMPPLAWALGYCWAALATDYPRGWFVFAWYLTSHALFILWAASVAEYAMPQPGRRSRRAPPLWLIGSGQVCWGIGIVAAPHVDTSGLQPLLLWGMDMECWAGVWVLVGLVTFAAGWLPEGPDRWGFAGAVVLPLVWGSSYAIAWFNGLYERGGFIFLWYLTSHVGMALWAAAVPEYQVPEGGPERQDA